MTKNSYVGVVDKIRVIRAFPNMLVRFTLHTSSEDINCLVCKKELANLILFLDDGKFEVATHGHYNDRSQFIVDKFIVRNPDSFIREFVLKPLKTIA
ncbi:hypothetical protein [Enterococcus termitis]|uniref:Uncharacterized protein n=1 Tax=Enterococcus termitis TaxID=332950 RepID=A0A1E5GU14_9ENTE|nr:hypothetical protein [Enterococcus termitis]OEG16186.1 hypothetical protein BCR25_18505 [Enterococcus termitis]